MVNRNLEYRKYIKKVLGERVTTLFRGIISDEDPGVYVFATKSYRGSVYLNDEKSVYFHFRNEVNACGIVYDDTRKKFRVFAGEDYNTIEEVHNVYESYGRNIKIGSVISVSVWSGDDGFKETRHVSKIKPKVIKDVE